MVDSSLESQDPRAAAVNPCSVAIHHAQLSRLTYQTQAQSLILWTTTKPRMPTRQDSTVQASSRVVVQTVQPLFLIWPINTACLPSRPLIVQCWALTNSLFQRLVHLTGIYWCTNSQQHPLLCSHYCVLFSLRICTMAAQVRQHNAWTRQHNAKGLPSSWFMVMDGHTFTLP